MSTSDHHPSDYSKALGIWLSLVGLLITTAFVFMADSKREASFQPPPLQVKQSRPVVSESKLNLAPSKSDRAKSPLIRVNVTPGGAETLDLEIRGPYTLRHIDVNREIGHGDRIVPTLVQPTATGLKIGEKTYDTIRLEIVPQQSPLVRINGHLYRGNMRLFRRKDGLVSAVNVLPLEEYLGSVVDSEMPAAFPDAAREAQAIVSRTYALYQKEHANPDSVFDLLSSQRSQKYLGVEYLSASGRRLAGESESSRRAVIATRGIVCKHRGQLFCTYYSAVCGGQTTNGIELFSDASPVLKSVPCEWCRESDYYRWGVDLDRSDFVKTVQPLGVLSEVATIQQTSGPGGGVISRFQLSDGKKHVSASAVELRERFPVATLRSPHFSLVLKKDVIRAEGRGHGHGVGLCQWGARGQAHAGKSAHDIVRYYYPGAELGSEKY